MFIYVVFFCSAGVGRSGTFIALDILLEQAHNRSFVDVFECVKKLRGQRVHMVQTQVNTGIVINILAFYFLFGFGRKSEKHKSLHI